MPAFSPEQPFVIPTWTNPSADKGMKSPAGEAAV